MIAVPSQPPTNVSVTATTPTSIEVSWKLPPKDAWNGIIKGFKLHYKKKNSPGSLTAFLLIDNGAARSKIVSALAEYTDYQFQVLAYTSAGDGPKSSIKYEKTMEDRKNIIIDKNDKQISRFTLTCKKSLWQMKKDGKF